MREARSGNIILRQLNYSLITVIAKLSDATPSDYIQNLLSAVYANNYCHDCYYYNYRAVIIVTIHRLLQSAIRELLDFEDYIP